jgi:tetratricopeptide (TPR) repeat protein
MDQIIKEYVSSKFSKEEIKTKIDDIILFLEDYANDAIQREDLNIIKVLIPNLEYMLKNILINENVRLIIQYTLCIIHNSLSEYDKAQNYLEVSLDVLKEGSNNSKTAYVTAYLGSNTASLGDNIKGAILLEESLKLYELITPQDIYKIAGHLQLLGYIYRRLGNYEEASQSLNKGLSLIKESESINYVDLVWVLLFIEYNYEELEQYNNAANFFQESLNGCNTYLPNNFIKIAWTAANFGNMQAKLGNLADAEILINKAIELCEKNLIKSNRGFGLRK